MREKCVLYQLNYFISTIHWCCQNNIIHSVEYNRICISKSFMRPHFFCSSFILVYTSITITDQLPGVKGKYHTDIVMICGNKLCDRHLFDYGQKDDKNRQTDEQSDIAAVSNVQDC